jgi:hypothetical protein
LVKIADEHPALFRAATETIAELEEVIKVLRAKIVDMQNAVANLKLVVAESSSNAADAVSQAIARAVVDELNQPAPPFRARMTSAFRRDNESNGDSARNLLNPPEKTAI